MPRPLSTGAASPLRGTPWPRPPRRAPNEPDRTDRRGASVAVVGLLDRVTGERDEATTGEKVSVMARWQWQWKEEGLGDRGIQGPSRGGGDRGRRPMGRGSGRMGKAKFGGWSGRSKTRGRERAVQDRARIWRATPEREARQRVVSSLPVSRCMVVVLSRPWPSGTPRRPCLADCLWSLNMNFQS